MPAWWAWPCWCSRGRACGRRVSGRSVVGAGARNSSYAYEMKVAASWKRAHPQWSSEASLTSTTHSPWIDKSNVAERNKHYCTPSLTASISTSLHFGLRSRVGTAKWRDRRRSAQTSWARWNDWGEAGAWVGRRRHARGAPRLRLCGMRQDSGARVPAEARCRLEPP